MQEITFSRRCLLSYTKKTVELKIHWLQNGELRQYAILTLLPSSLRKQRFVLINVEQTANYDKQYRTWPHLGLLYIGTVSERSGCEVVMWDELIQGHIDLENIIQPDDIVGLSLVATGIERGTVLAQKCKQLGARYVIAGNDSAIFRGNQLVSSYSIDGVFTGDELTPVQRFFDHILTGGKIEDFTHAGFIRTGISAPSRSNQKSILRSELEERKSQKKLGLWDKQDVFTVPNLSLFSDDYWNSVWSTYKDVYGHKHANPSAVKNALIQLAHGCTRTQGTDVCSYCTIAGVADIRVPSHEYLENTLARYYDFGISTFFNVTDSSYEMTSLIYKLEDIKAKFGSLTMYGRAQGIARMPQNLDKWLSMVEDRLLINVGIDSGDPRILSQGIGKSSSHKGESRLTENKEAIENIAKSGAHLHYSLIFGSPGESLESCKKNIDFLLWSKDVLGKQLDQVESDIYWLNHGAPASEVFTNYEYAQKLASFAGKTISYSDWCTHFASMQNTLVVPWETEESWYRFFTNITLDDAHSFNSLVVQIMAEHEGSISGRAYKPS